MRPLARLFPIFLSFLLALTLVLLGDVTHPALQPAMSELHASIWSPAQVNLAQSIADGTIPVPE
ncbi:hypothetical protein [Candidatus Entotheonella palauensis]|uniref:hypothetical protein n=1 Tax=Candidatus Entotheonella palauensis TaxID=93172 RepID=UPI0015C4CE86|nr:hypothetical protein [Candidatus Entotheonella palauensis]